MKPLHRRTFLKTATLTASALAFPFVASRNVLGANERLNIAGIGVGGKGAVDVNGAAKENIVALCDVDGARAAGTFNKFPGAKRFVDYRKMFDEMGGEIDAVTISSPDHMHAPQATWAMRLSKHVYLQKPLTHTVQEARLLRELAKNQGVATQMGNQGHSDPNTRRLVELIRAGVLGDVTEIHCWTDRPIWPQGVQRPEGSPPAPETLDWPLWLGVAAERPYHSAYAPFNWRGFWDFGTGALGDMACHVMDLPFFALGLKDPSRVEAKSKGLTKESPPVSSVIRYEFPATMGRRAVAMTWHDGGEKPSAASVKQPELPGNGVIMVGTKDTLYVPSYWGAGSFVSGAAMADFKEVPESILKSNNFDQSHYDEWIAACKGGPAALSDFDYSGPMTEAVLLGNVALRAGGPIEWDGRAGRVTNNETANALVSKSYPAGWF